MSAANELYRCTERSYIDVLNSSRSFVPRFCSLLCCARKIRAMGRPCWDISLNSNSEHSISQIVTWIFTETLSLSLSLSNPVNMIYLVLFVFWRKWSRRPHRHDMTIALWNMLGAFFNRTETAKLILPIVYGKSRFFSFALC